jgi:hypothetical protein
MGRQGLENVTDDLFSLSPLTTPESTPQNSPQRKMVSLPPLDELESTPEKATGAKTSQESRKRRKVLQGRKSAKKRKLEKKEQKLDAPNVRQKAHQKYKAAAQPIHTAAKAADSLVAKTAYIALNRPAESKKAKGLQELVGEGSKYGFTLQKWDGQ